MRSPQAPPVACLRGSVDVEVFGTPQEAVRRVPFSALSGADCGSACEICPLRPWKSLAQSGVDCREVLDTYRRRLEAEREEPIRVAVAAAPTSRWSLFSRALIVAGTLIWAGPTWAQEQAPRGFYYPTGTSNLGNYANWLAMSCNGENDYLSDRYHLGRDIPANFGDAVYAIADGEVVHVSTQNWGDGNLGVVVRHRLRNGIFFFAVYGHVRSGATEGTRVQAGKQFAEIGANNPPHLHFGINLEPTMPASRWGIMPCANWPETNGFVEPITWLTTQTPGSSTVAPAPTLDLQAQNDMKARAASDSRFGSAIEGSFGKNLNWGPNWELRWMDFNVSAARRVTMWHATSKAQTSNRLTLFWDPDTNRWNGWTPVN